jgi:hypothetical protein
MDGQWRTSIILSQIKFSKIITQSIDLVSSKKVAFSIYAITVSFLRLRRGGILFLPCTLLLKLVEQILHHYISQLASYRMTHHDFFSVLVRFSIL